VVSTPSSDRAFSPPLDVLACPTCVAALSEHGASLLCANCGQAYTPLNGRLDLRPTRARKITIEFQVGPVSEEMAQPDFGFLHPNPNAEIDYRAISLPDTLRYGNRLSPELLSYIPKPRVPGPARMLDLGCGKQHLRPICTSIGYEYIGLDHEGDAPLLGDAAALPLRDGSIDLVVALAVLEHLRDPFIAMQEVRRVMRPGGTFIGTAAFLEPFHLRSYFHCSHLGLAHVLQTAGFTVSAVAPNAGWSGLRALSRMGLFPRAPHWLPDALTLPIALTHRLWWRIGYALDRKEARSEENRVRTTTAGFLFIARKPADRR